MRRLLILILLAAPFALFAVAPAAADRPTTISEEITFTDVDPCTGNLHDVTIDVTFLVHLHDGVTIVRRVHELTTSSGYSGRGTGSFVQNGQVEKFRFSDMLTDDSGNRIRASAVFVVDLGSETVRVDRFHLTCVGA